MTTRIRLIDGTGLLTTILCPGGFRGFDADAPQLRVWRPLQGGVGRGDYSIEVLDWDATRARWVSRLVGTPVGFQGVVDDVDIRSTRHLLKYTASDTGVTTTTDLYEAPRPAVTGRPAPGFLPRWSAGVLAPAGTANACGRHGWTAWPDHGQPSAVAAGPDARLHEFFDDHAFVTDPNCPVDFHLLPGASDTRRPPSRAGRAPA